MSIDKSWVEEAQATVEAAELAGLTVNEAAAFEDLGHDLLVEHVPADVDHPEIGTTRTSDAIGLIEMVLYDEDTPGAWVQATDRHPVCVEEWR